MLLSNIISSFVYTRTKQSNVQDPFTFKTLLFIENLTQLLPIYDHWIHEENIVCDMCHIWKWPFLDLWPTLFLTFIHMPCLWPKTFNKFEHHKERETTNSRSRKNWCLSIVKYYTSKEIAITSKWSCAFEVVEFKDYCPHYLKFNQRQKKMLQLVLL